MDKILIDYLDKFEEGLVKSLLKYSSDLKALEGKLLESEDINEYWQKIEANYVADAVGQIAEYPTVSVAWASYLGMAVAYCWDVDWQKYSKVEYEAFYGTEGFDNMDDHIVADILGEPLTSAEAQSRVRLVQSLAQHTVNAIRHEQIEPQSKMAFYVFARACKTMFRIGAAIELNKLGYKFEKIQ